MTVFGLPAWSLALVVAGLSPFAASAWGKLVEKRVRERTARAVQRARARGVSSCS